ncbi:acetylserotonin O-methyltransferase [Agromyces larvae]|uniref:Acetylserotonin O-methyltransferase n=1 Tax=Agromyces larvae TaxID=2929802 RepID=A0ABY4C2Y8_9MICO|nr:acetylserotonin O-methyltransferase [Agromyces larvae]UOE44381.1 acetylserotonin O-methyltransferase [Agromyces larvae]
MTESTATPERILDIAIGFMGAKQLFAASRIGLFAALADGGKSVDELAEATGRAPRQVRILADSMAAQGLLERADGRYTLAADAAAYLAGTGEVDLTPFLAFLNDISYKQWLDYDATVDTDEPGTLELDEAGWGRFMAGVMTYNVLHGEQLSENFDFSPYRSALDLGGLSPAFAIGAMRQNPDLTTRFVFAPDFTDSVRQAVDAAGVGDRSTVEGGDTATVQPGGEHDLVMVNHVLHRFSAEENRGILANARGAAADGAKLLLLDFYLDDAEAQRKIDALHAGEYYNIDGTVVYPESEVNEWLEAAGWRAEGAVELPGSPRVLVATAV